MSSERRSPAVRIDCGTPEIAALVRQIDLHGKFGMLVEETVAAGEQKPSWVDFEQPAGEPLKHLIDRLGSRPPPVLVDAWCHQLAQIEAVLDAADLPLHEGSVDDLRVDSSARLHIAYLPLRIAESICETVPECGEQGSLVPWLRSRQEIDHGGFDFLAEAIENVSPSLAATNDRPDKSTTAGPATDSKPAIAAAVAELGKSGSPRRTGGNRSKPVRLWIAGATAAVIVIAVVVFWSGRADKAPPSGAEGLSEPHRTAAVPAADDSPRQLSNDHPPLDSNEPLVRLADEGRIDAAGFENAPVDLARNGFEIADNQPPVETSLRMLGTPAEAALLGDALLGDATGVEGAGAEAGEVGSAEIRSATEHSAASGQAVDLPMRDQTEPVSVPGLDAVSAEAMSSGVLQSPTGSETWRLAAANEAANEALADSASDSNAREFRVVSENGDGEILTAALLRNAGENESESGKWSWAWTAEAADMPAAEQLRNSRLSIDGGHIYLRTTTTAEAVQISFDQPQQTEEWSLVTAAAPRRSHISITAQPGAASQPATEDRGVDFQPAIPQQPTQQSTDQPADREPLSIQWLEAVDSESDRSVRGLAEIRDGEGSPIAVRVRFDIQAGRSIELATQSVATIEASSGWQPATHAGVSEAQDRVNAQQLEAEQLLRVIAQQYPRVEDRDERSAMRARRETLEERQKLLAEWTERLGRLQVLMARIAAEVQWKIELRTEWPDTSQTIFVGG